MRTTLRSLAKKIFGLPGGASPCCVSSTSADGDNGGCCVPPWVAKLGAMSDRTDTTTTKDSTNGLDRVAPDKSTGEAPRSALR
jgi:hypothetical protein